MIIGNVFKYYLDTLIDMSHMNRCGNNRRDAVLSRLASPSILVPCHYLALWKVFRERQALSL